MNKKIYYIIGIAIIIIATPFLFGMGRPATAPTKPVDNTTTSNNEVIPVVVDNTINLGNENISISNFAFSPATLTIKRGTTVTWTNNDSVSHTVSGDVSGPNSSPLSNSEKYSYTFNGAGQFGYHCNIHPSMKANIVVTE